GKIDFSSSNSETVIQNALNALTTNGSLFIKAGVYLITLGLQMPTTIFGIYGEPGTYLQANASGITVITFPSFNYEDSTGAQQEPILSGFVVFGNNLVGTKGIFAGNVAHVRMDDIEISQMGGIGIDFTSGLTNFPDRITIIQSTFADNGDEGVHIEGGTQIDFYDCHIRTNNRNLVSGGCGVRIKGTSNQIVFNTCHFDFTLPSNNTTIKQVLFDSGNTATECKFIGCDWHRHTLTVPISGTTFDSSTQNKIIGCTQHDDSGSTVIGDGETDPFSDNIYDLGTSALRWRTLYTPIINSGVSDLTLTPNTAVIPSSDNSKSLGTSALRWLNMITSGNGGFYVYGAVSDANPTSRLSSMTLDFGVGGATAVDTTLSRASAAQFQSNSSLRPTIDNSKNLGDSTHRWASCFFLTLSAAGSAMAIIAGNNKINWDGSQFYPDTDNVWDLGFSTKAWRDFYVSRNVILNGGKITKYNGITTAGFGVPAIVGEGDLTGQTGTVASVAAYTVGAANGVFKVGGDLDVTAFTSGTINLQVTYTDWNSGAQTITIDSVALLADTPGNEVTIMAKASTSITIKTTGTFTATYNVAATITQYK
ncbi:MAG TPA: right-handed parallel beta-helix repeat-containing protein, partial [Methylomirabilota bacterium]|nr:right-handed parallel beta-helix repeat-containing protein [Methylomirabilota bacterium]